MAHTNHENEGTTERELARITQASRTASWIALVCMALVLAWLVKQPAALERSATTIGAPASAPSARVPDFRSLDAQTRKAAFFKFMRPIATNAVGEVERERESLRAIAARATAGTALSRADRENLIRLARDYGVSTDTEVSTEHLLKELTERVDTIPTALVLVQAAKESGWGTSRFALEGNSFFGERCYDPGCGIAPAALKNPKFNVERFANVEDSVRSYLRNINTHPRYEEFRQLRLALRRRGAALDGIALAATLDAYSERREAYVAEVASLIAQTGLPTNE